MQLLMRIVNLLSGRYWTNSNGEVTILLVFQLVRLEHGVHMLSTMILQALLDTGIVNLDQRISGTISPQERRN